MTDVELAVRFFLQLAVILLVCRAVGWFGRRYLGQTQVVMEMIAGVLLGPSLFGMLAPQAQAWLFPQTLAVGSETIKHPSMSILYVASQLGLVLYMFLVGLEFDTSLLKQKARGAVMVSLAGIALPFSLGVLVSLWMREPGVYFSSDAQHWEGAVFMGAAMCITAFPMLARIISERGLAGTSMGTLALAAGATDDAMAWAMLAVVISSFTNIPTYAIWAICGGGAFAIFMAVIARRWLAKLETWTQREDDVTQTIAITTFSIVSLAAWFTDAIGIYAVFGAFITGACMPRGKFSQGIRIRTEYATSTLLLPLFFCYSGLNTNIKLMGTGTVMAIAAAVIVFAIAGKWLGCMLAARVSGESWRDAASIGVLMNARGLMELIILNIGLQHGVITQTLYTVMVMMAIVTTVMASPIFARLYRPA